MLDHICQRINFFQNQTHHHRVQRQPNDDKDVQTPTYQRRRQQTHEVERSPNEACIQAAPCTFHCLALHQHSSAAQANLLEPIRSGQSVLHPTVDKAQFLIVHDPATGRSLWTQIEHPSVVRCTRPGIAGELRKSPHGWRIRHLWPTCWPAIFGQNQSPTGRTEDQPRLIGVHVVCLAYVDSIFRQPRRQPLRYTNCLPGDGLVTVSIRSACNFHATRYCKRQPHNQGKLTSVHRKPAGHQ